MDDDLPDFDRFGHDEAWRLGSLPIRVHGTQVGVLSLSGLEPTGDHVLVVQALRDAAEAER